MKKVWLLTGLTMWLVATTVVAEDSPRIGKERFSCDLAELVILDFSRMPTHIAETGMTFSLVELPYDFSIGLSFGLGRSIIHDGNLNDAMHLMAYAGASIKYHGWPYPTLSVNWRPHFRYKDLPGESSPVVRLDNVSAEMKIGIFKMMEKSSLYLIMPVTATLGYTYYNGKHYPMIGVGIGWWGFI